MEKAKCKFTTASPDEQCEAVTKKDSKDTKSRKSFRGCVYQTVAGDTLFTTMPSTTPNKGIEQDSDFDIKNEESVSGLRAMLQDYVKRAEKAANVSEQQTSPLANQTLEGQRTALPKKSSQKQLTQAFQGIIQTIVDLAL